MLKAIGKDLTKDISKIINKAGIASVGDIINVFMKYISSIVIARALGAVSYDDLMETLRDALKDNLHFRKRVQNPFGSLVIPVVLYI